MKIEIVNADYHDPRHAAALIPLPECYALDPMGGGQSLSTCVKQNLLARLAQHPMASSVLVFAGYQLAAENGNALFWQKRLAA